MHQKIKKLKKIINKKKKGLYEIIFFGANSTQRQQKISKVKKGKKDLVLNSDK